MMRIDKHNCLFTLFGWILTAFMIFSASACSGPLVTQGNIAVQVIADGQTYDVTLSSGSNVSAALEKAGIIAGTLDEIKPAGYTTLTKGMQIIVTRVREEFHNKIEVIPFEEQTIHNESMPEKKQVIIQKGQNGQREITRRILYEDDHEVSNSIIKTVTLQEPVPQIVMVGVQTPFHPVTIPGIIAYLAGGNAWIMDGSTGSRTPVTTSGDLDGDIFSLSWDRAWLLFSRKTQDDEKAGNVNSLWVKSLKDRTAVPVSLQVSNVVHFAAWSPNQQQTITYSTVEPRNTALGWQANNDLNTLTFSASGFISGKKVLVESNNGGVYGWWGTDFAWSPDGEEIAYAQSNSVGTVDVKTESLNPLLDITPYSTGQDWAWLPALAWSPDNETLFTVTHAPASNDPLPENSPYFDLSAILRSSGKTIALNEKAGMFAFPSPSELMSDGSYKIAYLEAIFPEESSSRYRLVIADQDGSNHTTIFPEEGSQGLEPQKVIWSPATDTNGIEQIALLYQNNIWLVNADGSGSQQITGDGLTNRIDWK